MSSSITSSQLVFLCTSNNLPSHCMGVSVQPYSIGPGFVALVDGQLLMTSRNSIRIFSSLDSVYSFFSRLPLPSGSHFILRISAKPHGDLLT